MEIHRMTKAELYKAIKRYQDKIRTAKDVTVRERYRTRYKMARKHFYECNLCADARTETCIGSDGDEEERYVQDCGLEVCPYHDYFVDLANEVEDDVTKGLKIFLSGY